MESPAIGQDENGAIEADNKDNLSENLEKDHLETGSEPEFDDTKIADDTGDAASDKTEQELEVNRGSGSVNETVGERTPANKRNNGLDETIIPAENMEGSDSINMEQEGTNRISDIKNIHSVNRDSSVSNSKPKSIDRSSDGSFNSGGSFSKSASSKQSFHTQIDEQMQELYEASLATDLHNRLLMKQDSIWETREEYEKELLESSTLESDAIHRQAMTSGSQPATGIDWQNEIDFELPPVDAPKKPEIRPHQYLYRPASTYLRNPFYQPVMFCPKMCCETGFGLTSTGYSGPDKSKWRKGYQSARQWEHYPRLETPKELLQRPNPTASVPMRPRKWKKMTFLGPQKDVQEWKVKADQEKAKKDHEKAQKLGYETLVGNLVYYKIPGAKDLNRSWSHFLDQDPMAWGFPYTKGSRERPCLPLPSPYLVHQMKEQLWRYPRNKLIAQPPMPSTSED